MDHFIAKYVNILFQHDYIFRYIKTYKIILIIINNMNLTLNRDFFKKHTQKSNIIIYKSKTNFNSPNVSKTNFEMSTAATSFDKKARFESTSSLNMFNRTDARSASYINLSNATNPKLPGYVKRNNLLKEISNIETTVEDFDRKLNQTKSVAKLSSKYLIDYNSMKTLRKLNHKTLNFEDEQFLEAKIPGRRGCSVRRASSIFRNSSSGLGKASLVNLDSVIKEITLSQESIKNPPVKKISQVSKASAESAFKINHEIEDVKKDLGKYFSTKKYFPRIAVTKNLETFSNTLKSNIEFYLKYKMFANEKNTIRLHIEDYDLVDEIKTKKVGFNKPGNIMQDNAHAYSLNPKYVKTKFKKTIPLTSSLKMKLMNF
jgi:hypothetical protein